MTAFLIVAIPAAIFVIASICYDGIQNGKAKSKNEVQKAEYIYINEYGEDHKATWFFGFLLLLFFWLPFVNLVLIIGFIVALCTPSRVVRTRAYRDERTVLN
jgi:hypothetical protein